MGFVPSFDAIVGADFLLQADLEIALADKQIRFFRPVGCKDAFLGYWDADAVVVPLTTVRHPNPSFSVEINGQKMDAFIDSGASRSTISVAAARRAGVRTDSPGVIRSTSFVGVGKNKVARYTARFDLFTLGREKIGHAKIDLIDRMPSHGMPEVVLGADFLRAHRVLIAMSQKRLYISYTGGEAFPADRASIEPWVQREADAGNADAQFMLAQRYLVGLGVPKDARNASHWLDKATAQGHPQAHSLAGRNLFMEGRYPQSVAHFRSALDRLPHELDFALWLFLARTANGDTEAARRELETLVAARDNDRWPSPVAEFLLGRINETALLARAAKGQPDKTRRCAAASIIWQWHTLRGRQDAASERIEATHADCAESAD